MWPRGERVHILDWARRAEMGQRQRGGIDLEEKQRKKNVPEKVQIGIPPHFRELWPQMRDERSGEEVRGGERRKWRESRRSWRVQRDSAYNRESGQRNGKEGIRWI